MVIMTKTKNSVRGQTAMELAVFGAVILFVLGLIIKQSVSNGYQQNFQLKAMRQALLTSCNYSGGCNPGVDSASRNSSTIIYVQDRLTASSAKYGSVDRMPLMASATGTHSHNLFYPVEDGEDTQLPIFDLFVNGQHFQLTASAFINWCLGETAADCQGLSFNRCALRDPSTAPGTSCDGVTNPTPLPWDANCATMTRPGLPDVQVGCPIVSEIIYNNAGFNYDVTADERFDLDRDGTVDVPVAFRPDFAWQWDQRRGFSNAINESVTLNAGRVAMATGTNATLDFDGDNKEETLMKVLDYDSRGVVRRLRVIDSQEGDMDSSIDDGDPEPPGGFTNNVQLYTFLKGSSAANTGTYALVEEGKLFPLDTHQYIRTTRRKDTIDIIQREFQLHNIDRLCYGDAGGPIYPVEVCVANRNDCFQNNTVYRNCIWIGTGVPGVTYGRLLFIRSRIQDLHGRKYITDVTDDSNIILNTPPLP